ncbi:MAG: hypothetical protein KDJ75_01305 [Alphaproteobacteria bacterium]|nr:hypothetical protein [Alphaproteobacteria bacterium]
MSEQKQTKQDKRAAALRENLKKRNLQRKEGRRANATPQGSEATTDKTDKGETS